MPPERRTGHRAPLGVLAEGGATLDAVGPGTVLGGRYALANRLDDAADRSTWQAQDTTLDRRVRLLVVSRDHPAAEDVLDAARRAAAVDDPRLVRVLDVGHDEVGTYVVTEWLDGHDLATLVAGGPLVAEQARGLVGEACLALEAARRRGLHHLRLRPALVHRLEDGAVKVEGLVTEAVLDRVDVEDGDEASRLDATGLVAVTYAALTGLWPGDEPDPDLAPAPRLQGLVAPPSQLVAGVPADLDTLCAQTFAGHGGPATPGDLAGQIAPWGRERHTARANGAFPHPLPPVRLAPGTPGSPGRPLREGPVDHDGDHIAEHDAGYPAPRRPGRKPARAAKRAARNDQQTTITAPHPTQPMPQPTAEPTPRPTPDRTPAAARRTPDLSQQTTQQLTRVAAPHGDGPPTQAVEPVATHGAPSGRQSGAAPDRTAAPAPDRTAAPAPDRTAAPAPDR
ncbi:MAG TPA: hypothetical protein VKB14_18965, partial [Actinomycetales bacterium]|nr:hypothetical protein [Actinomycetales bacterium]